MEGVGFLMTFYPNFFSDNFDRADSTNIGPLWEKQSGPDLQILSNALAGNGAGAAIFRAAGFTSRDLIAQLTITQVKVDGDLSSTLGFIVGADANGDNGYLCRYLWANTTAPDPGNMWTLSTIGGATLATLAETITVPIVVYVTLKGTVLTVGTPASVKCTATIPSGNLPGTFAHIRFGPGNLGTLSNTRADNLIITSLDEAPTPPVMGGSGLAMPGFRTTPYSFYKNLRKATQTVNNLTLGI